MNIVLFYHSLVSDWNHGNAHFLRGIVTELRARNHLVRVYEPRDSWSLQNLVHEHGPEAIQRFRAAYPGLESIPYASETLDLDEALDGADLVIVHEWNEHRLVAHVGAHHARQTRYQLFFHDTHHRMVTAPESMGAYNLSNYDGVLAYGRVLQDLYEKSGRVARAFTWHEAADTRVFRPLPEEHALGDLVWVGNWGDGERTAELQEYLIRPAHALRLQMTVFGVRYPQEAKETLSRAGISYGGWLPNFHVPVQFARHRFTVHVPRRPYVAALPGIPTIRPFEAMACGIPLISAPWNDVEGLFRAGRDYLMAKNEREMLKNMAAVMQDEPLRSELASNALRTIRARHTCAHRVDELLDIYRELKGERPAASPESVSSQNCLRKL